MRSSFATAVVPAVMLLLALAARVVGAWNWPHRGDVRAIVRLPTALAEPSKAVLVRIEWRRTDDLRKKVL